MQQISAPAGPPARLAFYNRLSLRTKLILGNLVIAFVAIAVMGYYIFYRTQQSSELLTSQFESSVQTQAQAALNAAAQDNATSQNNFFAASASNVVVLRSTLEKLLAQEATLQGGTYWSAQQSLSQLASGAWDNSNTEPGSVFVPAGRTLSDALANELNTAKQLDFVAPSLLSENPDVIAVYFGGAGGETLYYPNVDLAHVVPANFDVTVRPWFVKASPAQDPDRHVVWSDPYLDAAQNGLVVTSSAPVYDANGNFRGVAAMDIQLRKITELVSKIRLGYTGYSFVIDSQGRLIAMTPGAYSDLGISATAYPLGQVIAAKTWSGISPDLNTAVSQMEKGKNGLVSAQIGGTPRFIAYYPLTDVHYSLAIVVPQQELISQATAARAQIAQQTRGTIALSLSLVVAILALVALATLGIGNALTSPLERLTRDAQEIADGNLNVEAAAPAGDEIGTLASTLNKMTAALRGLVGDLEARVSERTRALERQAVRLRTAAEVARDAASARTLDELFDEAARLIQDRFGFYHTGLFLLDEERAFAVLRASPTPAGREMIANHHRLRVGEQGIVGLVASTGEPRIALDTGADPVYFNNPLLPATRSEMALPLKSNEGVIGVLDIQSEQSEAFVQEDIEVMQIVADQLATAIEKTRLLQQVEQNLKELQRTYEEFTSQAWTEFASSGKAVSGYRYSQQGLEPLAADSRRAGEVPGKGANEHTIIPIRLRGQTVGSVDVVFQQEQTPHATRLAVEQITDRIATALENARLLEETRQRAQRDYLVGEISNRFRATLDIETILKTAAQEFQQAFQLKQAEVRLGLADDTPESSRKNGK